jgi:hypothetical protein
MMYMIVKNLLIHIFFVFRSYVSAMWLVLWIPVHVAWCVSSCILPCFVGDCFRVKIRRVWDDGVWEGGKGYGVLYWICFCVFVYKFVNGIIYVGRSIIYLYSLFRYFVHVVVFQCIYVAFCFTLLFVIFSYCGEFPLCGNGWSAEPRIRHATERERVSMQSTQQ